MIDSPNAHFIRFINQTNELKMSSNIMSVKDDDVPSSLVSLVSDPDPRFTWILSLLCAALIGFTGVVPLVILPPDLDSSSSKLRLLLAFSVGGLLGDVFLHILPEAWSRSHQDQLSMGSWVVAGLFTFTCLEVAFSSSKENDKENAQNKYSRDQQPHQLKKDSCITGYLNMVANGIDNFSHGLAVAASFLVGVKIGLVTTFAIILHEVPHEFGDFAILLKSGFSKWEAAKAQASTATIGLLGATVALMAESSQLLGSQTSWILPFTAGGFLHISMVSIMPELVKEENPVESLKQLVAVGFGVGIMAFVNVLFH